MGDVIKQIIDGIGDAFAKVLGKEIKEKEIVYYEVIESSYELYQAIFKLVENGDICKAEDLLYFELDKEYTDSKFLVGIEFYNKLRELGDKYLLDHNFSLQEVTDGLISLDEMRNLYSVDIYNDTEIETFEKNENNTENKNNM